MGSRERIPYRLRYILDALTERLNAADRAMADVLAGIVAAIETNGSITDTELRELLGKTITSRKTVEDTYYVLNMIKASGLEEAMVLVERMEAHRKRGREW